ncbi:hypothetical protein [Salinicola avicenniae]|uniref:hypothetical protein n=1 Tax=Salinicola avicenniae TaxID=2916836 RepID=UPI0020730069|nr:MULTISPECIES: hypothetical protein [unclassified Salinicola]
MSKLNDQFDVLSNTLRLLPEEILRLGYFIKEINEPEEGISNVEIACVNVFNNIYGMMCALKDEGAVLSIYEHDAITTILCIRHILQHQSGRLKNNLRDAWSKSIQGAPVLIKYNVSDPGMADPPLYISVEWFQEGIFKSNNAKRLPAINSFWNLEAIKQKVDVSSHGSWASTYVCVMALITEAVRKIVTEYGSVITASGYDSDVYLKHFKTINAINTEDYGLIT